MYSSVVCEHYLTEVPPPQSPANFTTNISIERPFTEHV